MFNCHNNFKKWSYDKGGFEGYMINDLLKWGAKYENDSTFVCLFLNLFKISIWCNIALLDITIKLY